MSRLCDRGQRQMWIRARGRVSLTVVDPDTKAPIGAITFGVNVDAL